jgi:Mu-like prophage I protein
MTTIDLGGARLSEDRPTWLHCFPIGTYRHPEHGALTFTRERLERIADGVNDGVRGITPALDFDHRTDVAKGGKAAGWIEAAEVRADGLWIAVRLTAEALAEVRAGHWRYLSPEFGDWSDPRTGVRHSDVLLGAALTNRPFLRDLAPVAACEPAIWSDPRVRAAGIALADVDPQAAFVRLAEQVGSYRVAAREHPEVWAAARAAADLNGPGDAVVSDGIFAASAEVMRLVEQKMAAHGLTASEATYWVMDERPDLQRRLRGVTT